jgi:hypothetical protein
MTGQKSRSTEALHCGLVLGRVLVYVTDTTCPGNLGAQVAFCIYRAVFLPLFFH